MPDMAAASRFCAVARMARPMSVCASHSQTPVARTKAAAAAITRKLFTGNGPSMKLPTRSADGVERTFGPKAISARVSIRMQTPAVSSSALIGSATHQPPLAPDQRADHDALHAVAEREHQRRRDRHAQVRIDAAELLQPEGGVQR